MNRKRSAFLQPVLFSSAAALLTASGLVQAQLENTEFDYGGYIKLDTIVSDYSDGSIAGGSIGRDFYIPSLTPVGGASGDQEWDMHARQTRFSFKTKTDLDNNAKLGTYIEMDFMATPNGDERISNSYSPRVRHAFMTYDNWLFGQTWSTFQNVSALPETLDFIGVTDGTIFVRQAQIRYSTGGFHIALENPETTVTTISGATASRVVSDNNSLPDIAARYDWKSDAFDFTVAGLARQLKMSQGGVDDDTNAFGVSVSGVVKFGRDDLRFMVNGGSGLGRYVGLNVANGAIVDGNNELETIDSVSGFVAYRHWWNDQWRSVFTYSQIDIDNDTALIGATDPTAMTASYRANLLVSPVKNLTFGIEYSHATRELESGAEGDMDRLQFSAKLSI